MSVALQLFESLNDTHDERERNRLIARAFEQLEERYPQLLNVATRTDLSETELRLQLQIKQVDSDLKLKIEEVECDLKLEIEKVESNLRLKIEKVESNLKLKIEEVESNLRLEIECVRKDIKQIEVSLHQAMAAQTRWLIGGLAALGALFKLIG